MKLRSLALALALTFSVAGVAGAKTKSHAVTRHKYKRAKLRKYNAKKANRASARQFAKQRKKHAA